MVEIIDNSRGLWETTVALRVVEHGKLTQWPMRSKYFSLLFVTQVNNLGIEGRSGLVQCNKHLVTIGRQRVVVERQGHDGDSLDICGVTGCVVNE